MKEFINDIESNKFSSTNGLWNILNLNDPWSVGYVTSLIEASVFQEKEDWEKFYYDSGTQRNEAIQKLSKEDKEIVSDELFKRNNPTLFAKLSNSLKNLNHNFGRTPSDFERKGKILCNELNRRKLNKFNLTEDEAVKCVRYRVICETWNGVIIREHNTINTLTDIFKELEFNKTDGEVDYKYAIDYEVIRKGTIICSLQIKPQSYFRNTSYLLIAQNSNDKKHKLYSTEKKVPVYYIISKTNGEIIDKTTISQIKNLINK